MVYKCPTIHYQAQGGLQIQNTINKLMHFVLQMQNVPIKQIQHVLQVQRKKFSKYKKIFQVQTFFGSLKKCFKYKNKSFKYKNKCFTFKKKMFQVQNKSLQVQKNSHMTFGTIFLRCRFTHTRRPTDFLTNSRSNLPSTTAGGACRIV